MVDVGRRVGYEGDMRSIYWISDGLCLVLVCYVRRLCDAELLIRLGIGRLLGSLLLLLLLVIVVFPCC